MWACTGYLGEPLYCSVGCDKVYDNQWEFRTKGGKNNYCVLGLYNIWISLIPRPIMKNTHALIFTITIFAWGREGLGTRLCMDCACTYRLSVLASGGSCNSKAC